MRHSNGVIIDVVLHSVGGSWEAVRSSVWHWGSSFHCVVVVSADNEMVVGRRPLFKTQPHVFNHYEHMVLLGGLGWVGGWGEGGLRFARGECKEVAVLDAVKGSSLASVTCSGVATCPTYSSTSGPAYCAWPAKPVASTPSRSVLVEPTRQGNTHHASHP